MENNCNCNCNQNIFNKVSQIPIIEVVAWMDPDHSAQFVGEYIHIKKCLINQCESSEEENYPFRVSPKKNIFYCFKCHQGGDAITLVSKIKKLSQIEAASCILGLKDLSEAD